MIKDYRTINLRIPNLLKTFNFLKIILQEIMYLAKALSLNQKIKIDMITLLKKISIL